LSEEGFTAAGDADSAARIWILGMGAAIAAAMAVPLAAHIIALGPPSGRAAEMVDKASWALVLIATLALGVAMFRSRIRDGVARVDLPSVLLFILMVLEAGAIAWVERFPGVSGLWFGFGVSVLLLAVGLLPLIWFLVMSPTESVVRYLGLIGAVLVVAVYLPSVLQPAWAIIDPEHSAYIVNEVLAPVAHRWPMSEQIPQYTSLLGIPLIPVVAVVGHPVGAAAAYLTVLAVLCLCGLVWIAWRVLPRHLRALAPLLIIPLVLVKVQPADIRTGSIATLWSALPVRTLLPIALGVLLVAFRRPLTLNRMAVLGIVGGVAALNNPEFGIPALVAAGVVCVVANRGTPHVLSRATIFVLAAAAPFAAYAFFLEVAGRGIAWQQWIAFGLAFGSGFGSVPEPLFGTHLLILGVLSGSVVLGLYRLVPLASSITDRTDEARRVYWASATATFFGLAGLGSFGYYVGRSVSSGQLQAFLIFVAPAICAQLGLITVPRLSRRMPWRMLLRGTVLLLPASLAVGAVLQAPDPAYEWERVSIGVNRANPYRPYLDSVAADLRELRSTQPGIRLVGAVPMGNLVQEALDLPNYSVLDQPREASIAPNLLDLYCGRLRTSTATIYARGSLTDPAGDPNCPGIEVLRTLPSGARVLRVSGR
jgi:hypothetical protein